MPGTCIHMHDSSTCKGAAMTQTHSTASVEKGTDATKPTAYDLAMQVEQPPAAATGVPAAGFECAAGCVSLQHLAAQDDAPRGAVARLEVCAALAQPSAVQI